MMMLVFEGYIFLLIIEWHLRFRDLRSIFELLRRKQPARLNPSHSMRTIGRAMALACIFYPKAALCLQRSSATALLLRRHSYPAEMVIGATVMPFKSHAWVEVQGSIVNDKPYLHEMYSVLERC